MLTDKRKGFMPLTPSDISELYRRYSDRLLRYLMAGTGDLSTAQDLLHDTFMEIIERAHVHEMTDDILSLLYTIAGRNLTDYYRRCKETRTPNDIYTDESHGCEANYEDRMEIVRACDKILHLPDLLRRTMFRYIGGAAPKVQAAQDGVTEDAIWVRMHRARRMMVNVTTYSQGSEGTI